jgi:hypothetical protein
MVVKKTGENANVFRKAENDSINGKMESLYGGSIGLVPAYIIEPKTAVVVNKQL